MPNANARKKMIDTKAARIYESLKFEICNGDLKPGDRLIISRSAEKYDVSEIPVREAFNRLKAEGLLRIVPHKGIYVTEIARSTWESFIRFGVYWRAMPFAWQPLV